MNERIKAIGRQAGFAFIEDGVYGNRWYTSKCGMDASEFEKFAELVVLECIKMIENEAEQYAAPTWAVELVNDMHERFGVAE
jgi:hypothetical protein